MQRLCVCGKPVEAGMRLCEECYVAYGRDSAKWPEWVKFLTNDIQRETRYESRHRDMVIDDDVFVSPNARANLNAAKQYPNMDFEEFREFLHETGTE